MNHVKCIEQSTFSLKKERERSWKIRGKLLVLRPPNSINKSPNSGIEKNFYIFLWIDGKTRGSLGEREIKAVEM